MHITILKSVPLPMWVEIVINELIEYYSIVVCMVHYLNFEHLHITIFPLVCLLSFMAICFHFAELKFHPNNASKYIYLLVDKSMS